MAQRVAIVILNWNGWKDTLQCLQSIYQITYDSFRVVLVDNGSSDESIAKFREYCRGSVEIGSPVISSGIQARQRRLLEITKDDAEAGSGSIKTAARSLSKDDLVLIANERNYGFSEGCNIGMRFSLSILDVDYLLLLNNDTTVASDFLVELVKVGESDKRIGIVGPKIYYYDFCGRNDVIWFAGGVIEPWREKFFSHVGGAEIDTGQFDSGGDTEWYSGAAILIKKELAETALLNPVYRFGMEDVEYCLKARKLGYRVVYVPSAKIWHKGGVSWRKLGRRVGRDVTSHFYLIRENSTSVVYLWHVLLFFAIVLPKWVVIYYAEGGDKKTMRRFLEDMKRLFGYIFRGSVN